MSPDPGLRRLVQLALADVAARLGALVAVVVATRWLGPSGYGIFAYGFSAGSIAAAATEAGLTNHLMREAATRRNTLQSLVGSAVRLRLALTAASALITGVVVHLIARNATVTITAATMTAALSLRWVAQTHIAALLGLGNAGAGLVQQGAERVFLLLALPLLLSIEASPDMAAASFAVAAAGGWAVSDMLWKRAEPTPHDAAAPRSLLRPIRDAWPLVVAGTAVSAFLFTGPLMLGMLATNREAGLYGAALNLYLPVVGLPAMVMKAVIGELASAQPNPHSRMALSRLAFGAVALPGFMAIAADEVAAVVLGDAYAASGRILRILTLGAAASYLSSFFYYSLLAQRRERWYATATVVAFAACVAASPWLVVSYGARGAAAGLVLAEAVSLAVVAVLAVRGASFSPGALVRTMARPALAALLPLAAALLALAGAQSVGAGALLRLGAAAGAAAVAGLPVARRTLLAAT